MACYNGAQWSPSITDTTGTKYFVLYNEVSLCLKLVSTIEGFECTEVYG